jgi:hypothetical protein
MIYPITQLEWEDGKPYCSPRDYKVIEHIQNKKTMRVVLGKKIDGNFVGELYMDLTPKELKKHKVIIKEIQYSKVNPGQTYYLYSYPWVNPKSIKEEELKLKQRLERGY